MMIKVTEFDDELRGGERRDAAEDGLEATLRRAASKARWVSSHGVLLDLFEHVAYHVVRDVDTKTEDVATAA